ncbi:Beta-glucosidase 22 [Platanthera zijinensis]|uniref:Beta-glucosidase 22 n=1 Tax=Platanthera zijinensis TaxID=2320716 RepID=A0AAP0FZW4_9ASPA
MKKIAGPRLPLFTKSQSEALMSSFDFLGMNYYTSVYVSDNSNRSREGISSFQADMAADMRGFFSLLLEFAQIVAFLTLKITSYSPSVEKNDSPAHHPFLPVRVPKDFSGLQKLMQHLKKYGNFPIYIHENGFAMGADSALNDSSRIEYLNGYIGSTLDAIRNGADVKGYFVWSFLDVFEFFGGYKKGFGLYHVDFDDKNRPRTPKLSALWYSDFLKSNTSVAPNIKSPALAHLSSASL